MYLTDEATKLEEKRPSKKSKISSVHSINTSGHGLLEKPYENAFVVEFNLRNLPVKQQTRFDVLYKTVKVGAYIPDLIVHDKMIIDTKAIHQISNHEIGQIMNHLKIIGFKVGLILNFKNPRLK